MIKYLKRRLGQLNTNAHRNPDIRFPGWPVESWLYCDTSGSGGYLTLQLSYLLPEKCFILRHKQSEMVTKTKAHYLSFNEQEPH